MQFLLRMIKFFNHNVLIDIFIKKTGYLSTRQTRCLAYSRSCLIRHKKNILVICTVIYKFICGVLIRNFLSVARKFSITWKGPSCASESRRFSRCARRDARLAASVAFCLMCCLLRERITKCARTT